MKKRLSLIKREFRLFTDNKIMLTLYLGAPILYGLLFGAIYTRGQLKELPVIVVDMDQSPMSATFIDMLGENNGIAVKYVKHDPIDMRNEFIANGFTAAIIIPEFFEADILQRRHPEINSYINNSNLLVSGYVSRSINLVAGTFNAINSAKTGKPAAVIQSNTFRLFNPASNYLMFIWPSYLAVILQSVVLVVIAMSFASEKENGTFKDLLSIQRSAFGIMGGKLLVYWGLSLVVLTVYGFYFYLFRQSLPPHLPDVLVVSALFIASLSFQGVIAGLVFKSQLQAIQFLMILTMPAYIASGFSWPFDQNGVPAQIYGFLFPFMPFVNGFRILLIEHGTLSDIRDFLQLQVLQLLVYFIIAWVLLQRTMKKERKKTSQH